MSNDLERTLEDASDLRDVVLALRSMPQAATSPCFTGSMMARLHVETRVRMAMRHVLPFVAAACLALQLAFVVHSRRQSRLDAGNVSSAMLVACQRLDGTFSPSAAGRYVQAFAVAALAKNPAECGGDALNRAVGALLRTQNAAGGWDDATLSARNTAALARASSVGVAGALDAYKRARRYLRMHGICEMSDAEMASAAQDARCRLGVSSDAGLVASAALCAM